MIARIALSLALVAALAGTAAAQALMGHVSYPGGPDSPARRCSK